MSKKEEGNLIKDITEDDEETNLFRAEMMNIYKNKTEEELLNEKYRLEIKMYENEHKNPFDSTDRLKYAVDMVNSILILVFSVISILVTTKNVVLNGSVPDMIFMIGFLYLVYIIVIICYFRDSKAKDKNLRKCKQCKIALMCIDDILNKRQFQTVECNDKVKRYYIEVRDRK